MGAENVPELHKAVCRIVDEALRFYHLGEHPDTCVLGDPHCECPAWRRCQRLPDDELTTPSLLGLMNDQE